MSGSAGVADAVAVGEAVGLALGEADGGFPHLGGYVLGAGITGVALFVLMGVFVVPEDAPLHAWAGLAQRIVIVVVLFPCTVVVALRLLRVTRADDAPL